MRSLIALVALGVILGPLAVGVAAAEGLTMEARVLLQGHARTGSWASIEVTLANDGPPIRGELRLEADQQLRTRFSMTVDLPTGSRQTYVLHAQPPVFGRAATINLVADDQVIESVAVAYLVHDQSQLIVGILAEGPQAIIGELDLPASFNGSSPVIVPLTIGDLPGTAAGGSALDRLVWQDVDSNRLSREQLDALRRWLAGGGRLIIAGGTAGIGTLAGFPDDLLPFRPTATIDIDAATVAPLLGSLPDGAAALPAMAGPLARGQALVSSGDRAVVADLTYGSGRVTILGFDPTTPWLAESQAVEGLWRSLLPPRSSGTALFVDDGQIVSSVYNIPALALPPTSGLLILLGAYIVVIGPLNYLVLRRLDRREWAWLTMPAVVVGFAVAALAYGTALRGTDIVVNELAIVRGAPDTTEASAQVYFGVFSPTRSTYLVEVGGGALLATPISDPFGSDGSVLDVLQGTGVEEPSAVRNLTVGTGSLRTIRAEVPTTAPRMGADLRLSEGVLTGTFRNDSEQALESVAVVLGSAVAALGDVGPGQSVPVRLPIAANPFGPGVPDQVIGSSFDTTNDAGIRRMVRYNMVAQLTYDPNGMFTGQLPAEQAVILAFGRQGPLDVTVSGVEPQRRADVMYYVPIGIAIEGSVTFTGDLITSTLVEADALWFSKERGFLNMDSGSATLAYRPIPFEGTFDVSGMRLALTQGGGFQPPGGKPIEPLPALPIPCTDIAGTTPEGCQPARQDFMPEVELFDRTGEGSWVRLPRLDPEVSYDVADPDRYVDPTTGQVLVRFVNENLQGSVGFSFQLALAGEVR
ncbi:MAG: hypothetical protein FIA92_05050 [Chloroflexi bacterium]|nr:hypothetical protein [Chloroflexota bacterium]